MEIKTNGLNEWAQRTEFAKVILTKDNVEGEFVMELGNAQLLFQVLRFKSYEQRVVWENKFTDDAWIIKPITKDVFICFAGSIQSVSGITEKEKLDYINSTEKRVIEWLRKEIKA